MKLTLVTGNQQKLAEFLRMWPADGPVLVSHDVDLDEIQSLDSVAIVQDKARRAFEAIGSAILVEDVTAGLDALGGLPGPFIKYFEKQLGPDALYQISPEDKAATVTCTIGYFDGETFFSVQGVIHGQVVSLRGERGFGFDKCFMPDGLDKTFGEMETGEKDAVSHRSQAIALLIPKLAALSR